MNEARLCGIEFKPGTTKYFHYFSCVVSVLSTSVLHMFGPVFPVIIIDDYFHLSVIIILFNKSVDR